MFLISLSNCKAKQLRSVANELRIIRLVRHPNIVIFYGACVDANLRQISLIFELVEGQPLRTFIENCAINNTNSGEVPSDRYQLLLDISCALRYLHSIKPQVVHGDLSPNNIMVESLGNLARAKLIDFGLSRIVSRSENRLPMGGTFRWAAPEIFKTG
ncbi:unnamed protein product, partial [Polarella glacialis]